MLGRTIISSSSSFCRRDNANVAMTPAIKMTTMVIGITAGREVACPHAVRWQFWPHALRLHSGPKSSLRSYEQTSDSAKRSMLATKLRVNGSIKADDANLCPRIWRKLGRAAQFAPRRRMPRHGLHARRSEAEPHRGRWQDRPQGRRWLAARVRGWPRARGELVVTDRGAGRVYRVDERGDKTVIAGNGGDGEGGDGLAALDTSLPGFRGIWFTADGGDFLGTHESNRVWYVDAGGIIHALLGGDEISEVRGLSLDADGWLVIDDDDLGFVHVLAR